LNSRLDPSYLYIGNPPLKSGLTDRATSPVLAHWPSDPAKKRYYPFDCGSVQASTRGAARTRSIWPPCSSTAASRHRSGGRRTRRRASRRPTSRCPRPVPAGPTTQLALPAALGAGRARAGEQPRRRPRASRTAMARGLCHRATAPGVGLPRQCHLAPLLPARAPLLLCHGLRAAAERESKRGPPLKWHERADHYRGLGPPNAVPRAAVAGATGASRVPLPRALLGAISAHISGPPLSPSTLVAAAWGTSLGCSIKCLFGTRSHNVPRCHCPGVPSFLPRLLVY